MPDITLQDIIEEIDVRYDIPENLRDFADLKVGFATKDGEVPCLSAYLSTDGETLWFDIGEDVED